MKSPCFFPFSVDMCAKLTTVKGHGLFAGKSKTKRFGDSPNDEVIVEWMMANFPGLCYTAYESGCTGFKLHLRLSLEQG